MIALAVGMAAMAVLTAGMLLEYYTQQEHTESIRYMSDETRGERMREEISATYEHDGILLENRWVGDTSITGVIIICDNGAILRAPLYDIIPAGGSALIPYVPDVGACT